MEKLNVPLVSVIIPTYKDWERLAICLDALGKQTFPRENFEVIVVNNAPQDKAPQGFNIWSNCTIIEEEKPGSYSARNKAIGLAKGEILAFTDSDCIPEKDWIANAMVYFEDSEMDRVGGRVDIFCKDGQSKTLAELHEIVFAFPQKRYVEKIRVSVTANLFVRKEIFDKAGLFDSDKKSGEDHGWNKRVSDMGYTIVYGDNVIVKHPARRFLKELFNKRRRTYGGRVKKYKNPFKKTVNELGRLPRIFKDTLKNIRRVFASKKVNAVEKWKLVYVELLLYLVVVHECLLLLVFGREEKR